MTTATTQSAAAPSAGPKPVRIGDLLLERGLITQEQIGLALARQKESAGKKLLGEVLVEMGFVSDEQVHATLAENYGVPFVRLGPGMYDPAVLDVLPREFREKQVVLPLFVVRNRLTLAVTEPTNVFLIEEVERLTSLRVQVVAALASDIRTVLTTGRVSDHVFVIDQMMEDLGAGDMELVEQQVQDLAISEAAAGESPVIKLVNYIIFSAVQEGASDIHIEPGDGQLRVRFRVDGVMFEKMRPPHRLTPAVTSRVKIMAGLDISERRVPQDGGISVIINKSPVDLRVSTMPGKFGEKVVMRVIDNKGATARLDALGFGQEMLLRFRRAVNMPNGVVLVTGPTGSGKSTTLYAALNEIVSDEVNISTVEDPVEFNLPGVNQFQVHEKAGFTFSGALRSLLRQDPDIIMLGEIRDGETARIATQAALTGHLVLSTLHTNDAPSAVTRLTNIGVEPFLVAASLRAVLAQRLLRRVCKLCKTTQPVTAAQRTALAAMAPGVAPVEELATGTGCAKCRQSGYSGRVGVFELFTPDDNTLEAIGRGANFAEIKRMALAGGCYLPLALDGIEKVRAGVTTIEELYQITG